MINVYPLATEKAYGLSKQNIYVFDVPVKANKNQITEAVENQFKVKIVTIKTLVQDGKVIRVSRGRRATPAIITRSNRKKAYVTLAKGDSIKVFSEEPTEAKAGTEKKEKK